MYYADVAEGYYNAACPSHAQNGYEKNVLLDTETEECIFVPGEVTPEEDELIFRCRRTKGITVTTLKTPKREKKEKRNLSIQIKPRIFISFFWHPRRFSNPRKAKLIII